MVDEPTEPGLALPGGPSERELVAALQRLASARAQLVAAEDAAHEAPVDPRLGARNAELETAHADLLWAKAAYVTAVRDRKAEEALLEAKRRHRQALDRYGYREFADYLADREAVPTGDVYLEVARREFAAAQAAWDELQALAEQAAAGGSDDVRTAVIDLTGDDPRRIA